MKKGTVALLVALAGFAGAIAYVKLRPDEVPVTKCIGLHPDLDKVRDRFNRDTVRNLVYKNNSSDPLFYSKIVAKIEACEWTKSKHLSKRDDIDGERFALVGSPYPEDALHEKIAFVAEDWRFQCVVYNGNDFVVVVLSAWY
jgi:hypothetical protein